MYILEKILQKLSPWQDKYYCLAQEVRLLVERLQILEQYKENLIHFYILKNITNMFKL